MGHVLVRCFIDDYYSVNLNLINFPFISTKAVCLFLFSVGHAESVKRFKHSVSVVGKLSLSLLEKFECRHWPHRVTSNFRQPGLHQNSH